MKKLIAILILTIITINTWGAKAYPFPLTITQKDGKQLTYRLHGDEHFSYAATTDGVLLYQEGNDFYIAIINDNGEMISSNVLAHNAGQRTAEEIALIGKQDKEKFFKTKEEISEPRRGMKKTSMPQGASTLFPHTGSPTALVILADFADQKFKRYVESDEKNDSITMEIFDQYLNAKGKPTHNCDATLSKNEGSVWKYFEQMSYGTFTPQFDVKAVVHLSEVMATYGENWTGTNNHYFSSRMDLFIPEVCELAHEAGVDFSEYDENDDNYVDLIYIIYAGYGESTGGGDNTIWPQSGTPYVYPSGYNTTEFCTYDGKKIFRYGVHSELNLNANQTEQYFNNEKQINGIGLFCHEFSHCMGLPDFYPTTKTAQEAGNPAMEYWDLMDGGEYSGFFTFKVNGKTYNRPGAGYSPTAYTAWEREYMGWKEMMVLTDAMDGQIITLECIEPSTGGTGYKIFPNDNETGNEYVFIQNIQAVGWNTWLAQYMGHGMLVTYVSYNSSSFNLSSNSVNNTVGKSRMTIVPADGEFISSYLTGSDKTYSSAQYLASHKGDPFPGTSDVHKLLSIPMIWSGEPMEKPLLNIQEENGVITFYYLTDPTVPQIATDIQQTDIDSNTKETKIYTLDGRYVGKSTRGLAKGVYIINGKKTVIR